MPPTIPPPPQPKDWRVGLTVRPKFRDDPLICRSGIVLAVLPDGTGGLSDHDGILKIQMDYGDVILRRAGDWRTA